MLQKRHTVFFHNRTSIGPAIVIIQEPKLHICRNYYICLMEQNGVKKLKMFYKVIPDFPP